ncbi:MAG: metallophosphoesterase [Solobacterium sp.]|nr:metallophosphoesterase [Solobacterium sp.]
MISSDFHYTAQENISDLIVPLMKYAKPALSALFAQVRQEKPDVFIICGDNTNSGRTADMYYIRDQLRMIRDEGIRIVMVPGNHDLDLCTPERYESIYGELLQADCRDPHSLSYTCTVKDTVFFAMDDSSLHDTHGILSDASMAWLKQQLQRYRGSSCTKVFVSHHGVLDEPWNRRPELYRILNPGLQDLLVSNGVRLCLSGHQHFPSALIRRGILQITAPMPLANSFTYCDLRLRDGYAEERLVPIRFSEQLVPLFNKKHERSSGFRLDAVRSLLGSSAQTDRMTEVAAEWFHHMEHGTLGQFKKHMHEPVCEQTLHMLDHTDYGSWMRALLDEPYTDPSHILFQL